MGLRSFFSRSDDLAPGDTIEVLDDSGETVEATRRGASVSVQVGEWSSPTPRGAMRAWASMMNVSVLSARKQSRSQRTNTNG